MGILIIIFLSAFIGTLIGVMSGGGSSVISLPLFLWAGIPLPLAIATHKLYCVFAAPITSYNYLKGLKIAWRFLLIFAGMGLIGAYFGVQFALSINEKTLKLIIGIIILIFVIHTYFKKEFGLKEKKINSPVKRFISYFAALIMGFYESVLGSGNGIAFTVLVFYTRGFDLISALGHYSAIAFFWASFAAILYIQKGYFDFGIMLSATLGAIIGSYIGSKYARYKGNKFIKIIFITVGAILGIKLILNI